MRKALALVLALVAMTAFAQVGLITAAPYVFTDCAAGGSAATTVPSGKYLLTVSADAMVYFCVADSAATCVTAGAMFPAGFGMLITIPGDPAKAQTRSIACRSPGSAGDFQLTPSN